MHRPYSQFTSLIVLVAALALIGGIAIVLVTSRDSLSFAPEIWFGSQSSPVADPGQSPAAPTASAPGEDVTATVVATETAAPATATSTPAPTETLGPTDAPTSSGTALPEGVTAIAIVDLDGVAARVRDAPAGKVIGAVLKGAQVQILQGRQVVDGVTWVEVRDNTGLTGWMSEDLLEYTATPQPN